MNKDIASPRAEHCTPKGGKGIKQCLCTTVKCKLGILEQGVCVIHPLHLRSQRESGLDYHITDRIPFPYKVTSFIREIETALIKKAMIFEISLN